MIGLKSGNCLETIPLSERRYPACGGRSGAASAALGMQVLTAAAATPEAAQPSVREVDCVGFDKVDFCARVV